jgi:hypothetical protein
MRTYLANHTPQQRGASLGVNDAPCDGVGLDLRRGGAQREGEGQGQGERHGRRGGGAGGCGFGGGDILLQSCGMLCVCVCVWFKG